MMMTRKDLAGLSAKLESELVLSVYLAREHEDPGMGEAWRRRLAAALGNVRSDIESNALEYLAAFQRASEWVMSELDGVGRVLPHEGWCAFATVDRAWHSEGLPFRPPEMVRWRQGLYAAPYVRVFKSARPVVLGLMDRWHAQIFRFQDDELSMDAELEVDRMLSDAADVGVPKRASGTSGMRGTTGTDFAQRSLAEEVKRLRTRVVETIEEMCGDDGGVVVGGTREAGAAARKELEERLPGRVVEVSELSFDTSRDDLVVALRRASSLLTLARQSRFLDSCGDPGRGSHGWNETYRALAAGAVDTLLVSRDMIAAAPDDADRLIRLALTQGAEVEEVGAELGSRLMSGGGGVAARLRFLPASLQA